MFVAVKKGEISVEDATTMQVGLISFKNFYVAATVNLAVCLFFGGIVSAVVMSTIRIQVAIGGNLSN